MARRGTNGLVVFLGPSLPAREARRIAPRCTVLPPARQGDVWRALVRRPAVIALVDGLFESTPSVWHHELLDAVDAGIAVFGGASMGALRAAELACHGVVGIGRVHGWYRDGKLRGDDEVALLHAGPELGFRALTLPLVQVRFAAEIAVARGLLAPRSARALVVAAASVHYADRTWRTVLAAATGRLRPDELDEVRALVASGVPDVKAEDARATVAAAAAFLRSHTAASSMHHSPRPLSSLVRRRKLEDGLCVAEDRAVPARDVLAALARARGAAEGADDGLRRLLLAGLARSLGITVSPAERDSAERGWLARAGVRHRSRHRSRHRNPRHGERAGFLAASGLDDADAQRITEDLALERKVLDLAARVVPDGPSALEGLALCARLDGRWAATAAALGRRRGPPGALSTRRMSKRDRPTGTPPSPPGPFNNPFGGLAGKLGLEPRPAPAPGTGTSGTGTRGAGTAAPAPPAEAPVRVPARAVVRIERKGRGGKEVTILDKLDLPPADLARWLKDLKSSFGCGGAIEGDSLALQGDLRDRVKALLERRGVRKVTLG